MYGPRSRSAFPCPIFVAALPPCPTYLHHPDSPGDPLGFLGRHSAVCSTYGMGWLDRTGGYYPHHRIQRGDVCNAENSCEQEGAQEADSGECGHERSGLLQ